MRQPIIIGNWKMNGALAVNTKLIKKVLSQINLIERVDIVICPPYTHLAQVDEQLSQSRVKLGAQNVSAFDAGAYTGEISASMLCEFNCSYVLLGHSERRSLFQESNEQVASKFEAALNARLIPVLCVGETLEQRQRDETLSVVSTQIKTVLDRVGIQSFASAVIAYEPIWAIGTGETATPEQAQTVHAQIRCQLAEYDVEIAHSIQVIYGGSVNADNAQALFSQKDIDGGLIGGASLDANAFLQISLANSKLTPKT